MASLAYLSCHVFTTRKLGCRFRTLKLRDFSSLSRGYNNQGNAYPWRHKDSHSLFALAVLQRGLCTLFVFRCQTLKCVSLGPFRLRSALIEMSFSLRPSRSGRGTGATAKAAMGRNKHMPPSGRDSLPSSPLHC